MKSFKALLKKEYILSLRTLTTQIIGIAMPVGFFLLFASLWSNDNYPAHVLEAMIKQYMLQMTAFSSLSFAFFTLPFAFQEDRTGNRLKHIRHSPLPIWQYYLAKVIRIMAHFVLAILIVFAVGHFVKGVDMPLKDWLVSGGLLFLGASLFMPFGVLLGFLKSSESLSVVGNILYMGLAILGGLWMPVSSFPDVMQTLAKLTPTYHFNELLITYFDKNFSYQSLLILIFYAMIVSAISLALAKKGRFQE